VDGRKFHYQRLRAAVRPQVVHRWFNVIRKFATIRRRPSEAAVLFQLIALQSSWKSMTKN